MQAVKTQKVLVVLPAITWQGRNPVDDDGDGWPNTLTGGLPVRRERVFADGLPDSLVQRVAPLLIYLDRTGLKYDLTTDLGLATNDGPRLQGHTGVVLAGDMRWLPASVQRSTASRNPRPINAVGMDARMTTSASRAPGTVLKLEGLAKAARPSNSAGRTRDQSMNSVAASVPTCSMTLSAKPLFENLNSISVSAGTSETIRGCCAALVVTRHATSTAAGRTDHGPRTTDGPPTRDGPSTKYQARRTSFFVRAAIRRRVRRSLP